MWEEEITLLDRKPGRKIQMFGSILEQPKSRTPIRAPGERRTTLNLPEDSSTVT